MKQRRTRSARPECALAALLGGALAASVLNGCRSSHSQRDVDSGTLVVTPAGPCAPGGCAAQLEQGGARVADVEPDPPAGLPPVEAHARGARAALAVLDQHCGECHGPQASADAANGGIDRLETLLSLPASYRCQAAFAPVIPRMSGIVPHLASGPATFPLLAERRIVADFIDRDCGRRAALCDERPSSPACGVVRVEHLLEQRCGECHGRAARAELQGLLEAVEGLFYIDDMQRLFDTGKVVPCESSQSRLMLRMSRGEMPPATATLERPTPDEIQGIADFIDGPDGLCPDTLAGAAVAPGGPYDAASAAAIEAALRNDCGACHGGPPPRNVGNGPGMTPPAQPWMEARPRPEVAPIQDPCFEFLGDWVWCENAGGPNMVEVPGRDLTACLQACQARPDCSAVYDYTWLNLPNLGCGMHVSSCDASAPDVSGEEDGSRYYVKTCPPG